jgi:hypothetical protein
LSETDFEDAFPLPLLLAIRANPFFCGARELVERMYCAYLEAEDLGLDQGEGLAVNLDEALALL